MSQIRSDCSTRSVHLSGWRITHSEGSQNKRETPERILTLADMMTPSVDLNICKLRNMSMLFVVRGLLLYVVLIPTLINASMEHNWCFLTTNLRSICEQF